jgi:hypothetical protein
MGKRHLPHAPCYPLPGAAPFEHLTPTGICR